MFFIDWYKKVFISRRLITRQLNPMKERERERERVIIKDTSLDINLLVHVHFSRITDYII
jgi:hypothetical protein